MKILQSLFKKWFFSAFSPLFAFIFTVTASFTGYGQVEDSVDKVTKTINASENYDTKKWQRIEALRNQLQQTDSGDLTKKHAISRSLFHEFKIFKQDSAFNYGIKVKELATQLDSTALMAEAVTKLAEVNISAGMYKEGLEFLQTINPQKVPIPIKAEYYELMGRCYNEMADYSNLSYYSKHYNALALRYRKTALNLKANNTFQKKFLLGIVKYDQGDLYGSQSILLSLSKQQLDLRETALVNSVLGFISLQSNEEESAINYFSIASIADIQSSTKETIASTELAKLLYKRGDTEKASSFYTKSK